ncbi:unnamed protein product [Bemisia tabaci]|uniref:Ionotropic glutamate receptor C-terminal domain-containing protein n=1 Tax=Bemisia tabaci TaxID=7038 RepID=A0A9P0F6C8_BEMTA|nr:unnamed protein product [Bemisia tabaci]
MQDSNHSTYQRMWQYMEANPEVMTNSNQEGVDRVVNEDYAFLMESTSIEYEVERKCQLSQVGGLLDNKGYGIVMRKNSYYRNVLSSNVLSLQEKGVLTQLKKKWWKEKRGGGACQILALSPESERDPLTSVAFNACRGIVDESKQDLFYLYAVGLNAEPSFEDFNQRLHEASIKTILISHHTQLTTAVNTDHGKNIIFILNDMRELMSLIFYSVSQPGLMEENGENTKSLRYNKMRTEHQSKGTLPLYCVTVDGRSLWTEGGELSSKELRLSSAELEPNSLLSDRVFNATRGLYINKIWNSRNYLVFVLKNFDPIHNHVAYTALLKTGNGMQKYTVDTDPVARLVFCFKFFWRFFKGLRSVICHSQGCERYDPFMEKLISTESETDQYFFDFSWNDMHGKSISTFYTTCERKTWMLIPSSSSTILVGSDEALLNDLNRTINCTLTYPSFTNYMEDQFKRYGTEAGLKFDIDLQPFEYGLSLEGTNYSRYDFSVSFDTRSLCFATPHSGFMSQGLVIFKSFSPLVWTLIFLTILSFWIILGTFHYLQCKVFYFFYPDAEVEIYRNSSSLLTVYAYVMCGSPANLRLGHLLTEKALFIIFSFSAFIITNAFLGCMTTLLSKRVLYPELDSLKALEESELLIQIMYGDVSLGKEMFSLQNQSEILSAKLVANLYAYAIAEFTEFILNYFSFIEDDRSHADSNFTKNRIVEIEKNILSMAAMDAMMISVPFSSNRKENVLVKQGLPVNIEYHLMQECLITYPVMIPFLKNSFLYDKLNRIIYQNLETGHTRRMIEKFDTYVMPFSAEGTGAEGAAERPRRKMHVTHMYNAVGKEDKGYMERSYESTFYNDTQIGKLLRALRRPIAIITPDPPRDLQAIWHLLISSSTLSPTFRRTSTPSPFGRNQIKNLLGQPIVDDKVAARKITSKDGGEEDATDEGLDLDNVGGVFVVLVAGVVVGVVLALVEMTWHLWRVSVNEHVSFKDEMIAELKFVAKFHGSTKPVRRAIRGSSRASSVDHPNFENGNTYQHHFALDDSKQPLD